MFVRDNIKKFRYFFIILILILLVGCGNEKDKKLEELEIISNTITYNDGDIQISYPSLSRHKDTDIENIVNDILLNEVLSYVQPVDEISEGQYYNLTYEIMFYNEKILSVVYKGSYYTDDSVYPIDVMFSTNVDLENAKKLKFEDLDIDNKKLYEEFISILKQDYDDEMVQYAYEYILQNYDEDSIMNGFNEADETYGLGRYIFTYITNDNLIVSWEVPHVIGDHVEIEIPLEAIWIDGEVTIY
jgi:hypothetical protein